MIDIRRLQLFVAVAEELHFGRAAARVGMAQPPFSHQIRRLETELGLNLLNRNSRNVALTSAGAELLILARDLIERRDRIVDHVRKTANGHSGTLRLGFAASSAIGLLAKIVMRFREEVPDAILELDDRDGVDVSAAIRRGEIDVAIVRAPFEATDLEVELIIEEPFVVVMPAGHPLAKHVSVYPIDLIASSFVLFPRTASAGLHDTIIGLCIRAGFSPHISQEANAWLSIMGLVESGFGITIAPRSAQAVCSPALICRPIVGTDACAALGMATKRNASNPLIKRFQDVVRDSVQSDF